ncbi:MAG: DUF4037 domain-containing protein [Deltaproteobacteria bacterium]|nr:DUF4037 domain-containing protein [Deltaproteobacteria bacterium]
MKGLDLCEEYYLAYGSAMIKTKFPGLESRLAAGLVGEGSECFGFDDEISRDHDWGPGFCLWLDSEDYASVGPALDAEYQKLPKTIGNFNRLYSRWGKSRVGVMEIGAFYRSFIGLDHAPESARQWFQIPEHLLAACTNGRIFNDQSGKFSAIREDLLSFFPEEVRLAKMVARCAAAAQSGQYNYPRMLKRNDPFAAQYAVIQFCSEIISLAFLLNRRFCPYYKWRHRAVRVLPVMGEYLYDHVRNLVLERNDPQKAELIENVSSAVIDALRRENLSGNASDFLLDHAVEMAEKISDPTIARVARVWV